VLFQRWCVDQDISTLLDQDLQYGVEQVSSAGIVGARGSKAKDFIYYNHMPANKIINQIGEDLWQDYFKFVNVCNPYTKAVSLLFWRRPWLSRSDALARKGDSTSAELEILPELNVLKNSFTNMLKETKIPAVEKFLEQGYKLDAYNRYESLDLDIRSVLKKLDLDQLIAAQLPELKPGTWMKAFPDYRVLYNEESKELVTNLYKDWLDEFGYKL